MDELKVLVDQKPGSIGWNFEDLKAALQAEMKSYETVQYTEEMLPDAKKDVASLRKLKKAVDDERKAVKAKWNEPYMKFEAQAKELIAVIDAPISLIDGQIKSYEEERKKAKAEEIKTYFEKQFSGHPEEFVKSVFSKVYDPKWENATTTKKSWQEDINDIKDRVDRELKVINGLEEDFIAAVTDAYMQRLDMTDAMSKYDELKKQKEIWADNERRRAEEAAKSEAKEIPTEEEKPQAVESRELPDAPAEPKKAEGTPAAAGENILHKTFYISGTKDQLNKIWAYIKHVGAEVRYE